MNEKPEKEELLKKFMTLPEDKQKKQLQTLSNLMRVFDGKSMDAEDLISFNINLKDIKERTRFVTFPILRENVFFRLHTELYPEIAMSGELYADLLAKSYISYKGLGREEFRDIRKAAPSDEQGMFVGNMTSNAPQPPKKRFGFLNRSKKVESEFSEK